LQKEIKKKIEDYKNEQIMNSIKEDKTSNKIHNSNQNYILNENKILNNDSTVKDQKKISEFSKDL